MITKCGPDEHPCKKCGLPTAKSLELCNLCEERRAREGVQVFSCGGCVDDDDHVWDGPTQRDENTESATCSKCGLAHIDWCLMNAP